jgi:hypothetical protein
VAAGAGAIGDMKQGPNVKKLISQRMATIIIPPGTPNGQGLPLGVQALTNQNRLVEVARQATADIEQSIAAIKAAPDNPWGDDDEAIAGEILRQLEERKKQAK